MSSKKQTIRAAKQRKKQKQKQKTTFTQFEKAVTKKARKSGKLESWETFDQNSMRSLFYGGTEPSDAIDYLEKSDKSE